MTALRPDVVFSYWVFVWYLLYLANLVKYNPKFAFILGLIDNIIILSIMLYIGKNTLKTILLFVIINITIKVIPLYYLYNTTLTKNDIYFTVVLFIVFCLWLYVNGQTPMSNIKMIYNSLIYNKNQTPFMRVFSQITGQ